jgi:hypothetical protein
MALLQLRLQQPTLPSSLILTITQILKDSTGHTKFLTLLRVGMARLELGIRSKSVFNLINKKNPSRNGWDFFYCCLNLINKD